MDEPAPEGLLGQWLAQRHAPAADTAPAAVTDDAIADEGDAIPAESGESEPVPQPVPDAEPAPAGLATLAAAGAVLEAFAAGTLEIDAPTPAAAEEPAPPITRVEAPTTPEEAPSAPEEPSLANAAAAAVLAAFGAPPAPAAVLTTDPAPAPDQPAPVQPAEPQTRSDAAAAVVAAFRTEAPPAQPAAQPDTPPAGQPATPPAATPTPRPVTSRLPTAAPAAPAGSAGASGQSTEEPAFPYEIAFRPRTGARTLAGVLLLAGLAATAYAGWRAYQERTDVAVGIAATLAVATGIVWAVRAGSSVTRLSLRGSRLEVVRHGTRLVFDLADPQTAVEVVGTPGRRGWKVVFPRRTMDPVVLDASMVDPHELTRAIAFHRAHQRVTPGRR